MSNEIQNFIQLKVLEPAPLIPLFFLASIHNSEITRKKSNNFQSQGIKSEYEIKAFLSFPKAKFSTTRRLDGETRLKSRLLHPACKGSTQKVSPNQLSRSTATDDASAVRPGSSATNLRLKTNTGEIGKTTNEVNRFSGSHMGHQIQHVSYPQRKYKEFVRCCEDDSKLGVGN